MNNELLQKARDLAAKKYPSWYSEYDEGRAYEGFVAGYLAAEKEHLKQVGEPCFTISDIVEAGKKVNHELIRDYLNTRAKEYAASLIKAQQEASRKIKKEIKAAVSPQHKPRPGLNTDSNE